MNTTRINTWPAEARHTEERDFYRTMGIDVSESQIDSLRRTYRYARRNGLNDMIARIVVVHAFEAGQRTARDLRAG